MIWPPRDCNPSKSTSWLNALEITKFQVCQWPQLDFIQKLFTIYMEKKSLKNNEHHFSCLECTPMATISRAWIILNYFNVFLWLNKIMNFYRRIINLILLGMCHCLKQMSHPSKLLNIELDLDMNKAKDTVMVVVNIILGTMVIIVIRIEKTIQTIRSEIIQRCNLKKDIYIITKQTW